MSIIPAGSLFKAFLLMGWEHVGPCLTTEIPPLIRKAIVVTRLNPSTFSIDDHQSFRREVGMVESVVVAFRETYHVI